VTATYLHTICKIYDVILLLQSFYMLLRKDTTMLVLVLYFYEGKCKCHCCIESGLPREITGILAAINNDLGMKKVVR